MVRHVQRRSPGSARRNRFRRALRAAAGTTLLVAAAASAGVVPVAAHAATDEQQRCTALAARSFEALPEAPTFVTAAQLVPSPQGTQCRVSGYVAPQSYFIVELPLGGWNGNLYANGSHGYGGVFYLDECAPAIATGYATVTNSMGHVNLGGDMKQTSDDVVNPSNAGFAFNNAEAGVDFAYRATHVTTVAAKAIVEAFYGQAPKRSYFSGCSTGGRQGLVEAQRYPGDFDGIIAGPAPIYASELYGIASLYTDLINRDASGRTILTTNKLPLLAKGALRACDTLDGLSDGIISDPQACDFDPASLRCPAASPHGPDCLSAEQVRVAQLFYEPFRDSKGRLIYPGGGNEPGSELAWGMRINDDGGPSLTGELGIQFNRYLGYAKDPGPTWQETDFDLDRDPARLRNLAPLYSAADPDLSEFRARGGKVIMWSGWADQAMPPAATIKYYEDVENHSGGPASTREFARLFMVPGEYHCSGGTGPTVDGGDFLGLLDTWVTTGKAPDEVVAHQSDNAGNVTRTRPVYAYPLVAAHNAQGSPDDAGSFHPAAGFHAGGAG